MIAGRQRFGGHVWALVAQQLERAVEAQIRPLFYPVTESEEPSLASADLGVMNHRAMVVTDDHHVSAAADNVGEPAISKRPRQGIGVTVGASRVPP